MHVTGALLLVGPAPAPHETLQKALNVNGAQSACVVVREKDTEAALSWRAAGAHVIVVPDAAPDDCLSRARWRQLVVQFAEENGSDAIWWLEKGVYPTPTTLKAMLAHKEPVVVIPTPVRWLEDSCAIVTRLNPEDKHPRVFDVQKGAKFLTRSWLSCWLAGLGCTLQRREAFAVPFEYGQTYLPTARNKYLGGEDVGFFINLERAGLPAVALVHRSQMNGSKRSKQTIGAA